MSKRLLPPSRDTLKAQAGTIVKPHFLSCQDARFRAAGWLRGSDRMCNEMYALRALTRKTSGLMNRLPSRPAPATAQKVALLNPFSSIPRMAGMSPVPLRGEAGAKSGHAPKLLSLRIGTNSIVKYFLINPAGLQPAGSLTGFLHRQLPA